MYEKLVSDVAFLEGRYEEAAEMYLEGARDGDVLASFNYGYCLWRGIGVKKDPLEAKSFFAFAFNFNLQFINRCFRHCSFSFLHFSAQQEL